MSAYCIEVGTPSITLILLAKIKTATRHKYRQEFQLAMQSICSNYAYNHKHDNESLKVIMTELTKADLVRTLKDAPTPNTATANSVADTIEQLKTLTNNTLHKRHNKDDTVSNHNTVYGATTDKLITRCEELKESSNETDGWKTVTDKHCNINKLTVTHYTMPFLFYHFPITPSLNQTTNIMSLYNYQS